MTVLQWARVPALQILVSSREIALKKLRGMMSEGAEER